MKSRFLLLVSAQVLYAATVHTQQTEEVGKSKNFILVVVPEADTVRATTSAYRLSASTRPGNQVTVNGKQFKVYPSGAFCGKLELGVGENLFHITSLDDDDNAVTKSLVIIRQKPLETTISDIPLIEDTLMRPAQEVWLAAGDLLQVQIKGTPGCRATFLNGAPMEESPPSQTRGIRGIYRGTYLVKDADTLHDQRLTFRLEDSTGRFATRSTSAKVLFKPQLFPLVGVTKGERPYLLAGRDADRLGGERLSVINPGIRLRLMGRVGSMYRVALSENQVAWIEDSSVDVLPKGTSLPESLTGNLSVARNGRVDEVTLFLSDRLPYSPSQLQEPGRIVVDVYGATSNTNAIAQGIDVQEVTNVTYRQVEKDVFRITIELKHRQLWGYEIGYEGNSLKIKVRHQPERLSIDALTFAIDAGHGGENKGALGSTGVLEKDIVLVIAQYVREFMEEQGAKVLLTRPDDTNPSFNERFLRAYRGGADMLISIHANSVGLASDPAETKGAATFYKHTSFNALSASVLNEVLKCGLDNLGSFGNFNFSLLGPTEFPTTLVETAFISNPEDEMKLLDDDFRRELAERIVDGIAAFLDSCDE